jgi:hypothetical protein
MEEVILSIQQDVFTSHHIQASSLDGSNQSANRNTVENNMRRSRSKIQKAQFMIAG